MPAKAASPGCERLALMYPLHVEPVAPRPCKERRTGSMPRAFAMLAMMASMSGGIVASPSYTVCACLPSTASAACAAEFTPACSRFTCTEH